jgi:hypothetical protein
MPKEIEINSADYRTTKKVIIKKQIAKKNKISK